METDERLTTFAAAHAASPYELARRWGGQEVTGDLEELAVMSALADWLTRWLPINVHRALLTGASVDQVAAAGVSVDQVAEQWRTWADRQVELREQTDGRVGLADAERDRVAAILAATRGEH